MPLFESPSHLFLDAQREIPPESRAIQQVSVWNPIITPLATIKIATNGSIYLTNATNATNEAEA